MTTLLIFQSPRRLAGNPLLSNPINADDTRSCTRLLNKGWRVVETRSDEPEYAPDEGADVDAMRADVDWTRAIASLTDDQQRELIAAGYSTSAQLRAATDAQLHAVKGIGVAAVRNLRKDLKAAGG